MRSGISQSSAQETSKIGDALISHYGTLHMALRAVQEPHMQIQQALVGDARVPHTFDPVVREDITELRHIGAIPKYRGDSPCSFRVLGFPNNPAEQDYIMSKLRPYVHWGDVSLARRCDSCF